jgi:hypothetical protein
MQINIKCLFDGTDSEFDSLSIFSKLFLLFP